MVNKILKTLSKNLGFKVLAVLFAFTLWVTVYNLDDPTKTKPLTINVTVTNKEVLDDLGKYYEIQDGMNKVSFSVTAARSILDKLDESDFIAEANLQKLAIDEDGMTGTMPIDIFCTANVNGNAIKISSSSKNLVVALDDLMTKQFVVQANAVGEVAEGYALGKVEVTAPNVLKVSGPKSIVSQIASVVATVDVGGMSDSETSYQSTPILLDGNGNEIDTTRLILSNATVNVQASILNVKEVAIAVTPSGNVAEGYAVTGIHTNPATILLKGNKTVLNGMSAITIPSQILSVEGINSDMTVKVDVTEYIPEGVELAMPEQASVEIVVSVDKVKSKAFTIQTSDIEVIGLTTHTTLEYELSSVAVNIMGLEADINALTNEMLDGRIDVTEFGVGTYQVVLLLDLDESKYIHDEVKIMITITEDAEETGGEVTDSETESDEGQSEQPGEQPDEEPGEEPSEEDTTAEEN